MVPGWARHCLAGPGAPRVTARSCFALAPQPPALLAQPSAVVLRGPPQPTFSPRAMLWMLPCRWGGAGLPLHSSGLGSSALLSLSTQLMLCWDRWLSCIVGQGPWLMCAVGFVWKPLRRLSTAGCQLAVPWCHDKHPLSSMDVCSRCTQHRSSVVAQCDSPCMVYRAVPAQRQSWQLLRTVLGAPTWR